MFKRGLAGISKFHKSHRYPVAVIAVLGFGGFVLDYCWKPISTVGLILLGLAASPWLMRVIRVKKGTLAGWEIELGYPSAPMETGERLAEELREEADAPLVEPGPTSAAEPETDELPPEGKSDPPPSEEPSPASHVKDTRFQDRNAQIARAYMIEGLVFQELQRELGGTIQRQVKIGQFAIDGIVFGPSGPVAVEVKIVSTGRSFRNRLIVSTAQLASISSVGGQRFSNLRPLLAIVVENMEGASDNWRRRLREFQGEFPKIEVRLFSSEGLLKKYGLSES